MHFRFPQRRSGGALKRKIAALLVLAASALALATTPAMARPGDQCLKTQTMQELKACFESLPASERRSALERRFREIAGWFPKDAPPEERESYVTIQLNDEAADLTKEDAVELYRKASRAFVTAYEEANAAGKRLIFLGGESHDDRTDLMLGSMLTLIARRFGVTEFGFEVAEESLVRDGENAINYRGLWDELEVVARTFPARPGESEPLVNSYLGGPRHNREFELWLLLGGADAEKAAPVCGAAACWRDADGKIGGDGRVFAADPMFWNWEHYPNLFGYQLTREPTMATTLIEEALGSDRPIVAIYGSLHLQAIADLIGKSGLDSKLETRFLNFSQKVYIFNTDIADPIAKESVEVWNERILRALQSYREGENFIQLQKRGPKTAEEALDLAIYADSVAGSEIQRPGAPQ